MFVAYMIIVTLMGPIAVKDSRGPYATAEACETRLAEMVKSFTNFTIENPGTPTKIARAWCQKDEKGQGV
jgi:hypothetical protein